MKVIADTNIWYYLGQEETLFDSVKDEPIAPTFINIIELARSYNLIDQEDLTRKAIQKLFHYRLNAIFEPPFIYLAKLLCNYLYNVRTEFGSILEFTSLIAKGGSIDSSKIEQYRTFLDSKNAILQANNSLLNIEAEAIKGRIKDKKRHKSINTLQLTGTFINFCVEKSTDPKCSLQDFDLDRIELFVKTLDYFFKTLETSGMKLQLHDWYDFSILAYVQPGDKYWTKEKRWLKLIEDAGCHDYLYIR
jgi:hypothetical protein